MKTAIKPSGKLRIFEIALLIGAAVFLASGVLALGTQNALSDKVVRLHVLANSDSETDQALKLQVRDAVLAQAEELLKQSSSRREAEEILLAQLPELERLAAEALAGAGCQNPVTAELTDTWFPTREYDGFTLPAGRYLALRVVIGEGEGQNWWCVVFPPLCAAASSDVPAAALEAGFTEDEVGLITEKNSGYVLKFKAVELWENLRRRLN